MYYTSPTYGKTAPVHKESIYKHTLNVKQQRRRIRNSLLYCGAEEAEGWTQECNKTETGMGILLKALCLSQIICNKWCNIPVTKSVPSLMCRFPWDMSNKNTEAFRGFLPKTVYNYTSGLPACIVKPQAIFSGNSEVNKNIIYSLKAWVQCHQLLLVILLLLYYLYSRWH